MSRWKFILADSLDLSNNIAELHQARNKQLSVILNRAGSLSFTYPMEDQFSGQINPITSAIKAYRFSTKTNSWVCQWSGPVWTIDESISDSRMTVNCVGWVEMLSKRYLRRDMIFQGVEDADIIWSLLEQANLTQWTQPPHDMDYTVPVPPGSYPNTPTRIQQGDKMRNEGTVDGTPYVNGTLLNKTYQKYQPIGPAIQELTELENGCDIEISPEERKLNIYRKKMANTNVVFGYGWGPANLQAFNRQLDSSTLVNHMIVAGRAGTIPAHADTSGSFGGIYNDPDPDTRDEYGLLEEVVSLSDVGDTNILGKYALGELYVRYRPRIIYSLTPFPFTPGSSVPEPFVDYKVGDTVYLTAKLPPRINIQNQRIRIFGISVSIDEEGNERVGALQTTPG